VDSYLKQCGVMGRERGDNYLREFGSSGEKLWPCICL